MSWCVALPRKGSTVVMGVCLCRPCPNMKAIGDTCLFRVGSWHDGPPWLVLSPERCTASGMMSATQLHCRPLRHVVSHGGVNAFHVCLDRCVVHGVGICANVYGAVCAVTRYLSSTSACFLLCCEVRWVCTMRPCACLRLALNIGTIFASFHA